MASSVQKEALPEWGCLADIKAYDVAVGIVIKKAKKYANGVALPAVKKAAPKPPYKVIAGESITTPNTAAPKRPRESDFKFAKKSPQNFF